MRFLKFIAAVSLSAVCLTAEAQISELTEDEVTTLQQAIQHYHNNAPDLSIGLFEKLLVKHPDNYLVNYEYCLPKMQKQQFGEVVKITKKLEKSPYVEPMLFQLQGNAYDYMGKRKAAVASYDKGIKRFPKSGCLYMEKGNIRLMEKDPDAALLLYEKAFEVEPAYPSPYYRAAALFLSSQEPVWGLIYGEAFLLLEKGARNVAMQKAMVNKLDNSFELKDDTFRIQMSRNVIQMSGLQLKIPFPIIYELAVSESKAVDDMKAGKRTTVTVYDLMEMRKAVALTYKEEWKEKNPNYLFDYQNMLIEGGYFEAYTMYIFKDVFEKEYNEYASKQENKEVLDALKVWMRQHPFSPDENQFIKRNDLVL